MSKYYWADNGRHSRHVGNLPVVEAARTRCIDRGKVNKPGFEGDWVGSDIALLEGLIFIISKSELE